MHIQQRHAHMAFPPIAELDTREFPWNGPQSSTRTLWSSTLKPSPDTPGYSCQIAFARSIVSALSSGTSRQARG